MQYAKRNVELHMEGLYYDVEGMLVDYRSFPSGSSGGAAICSMFYPPLNGSFDILPGSWEHVAQLLSPNLPFSLNMHCLFGAEMVDSMRIQLPFPPWAFDSDTDDLHSDSDGSSCVDSDSGSGSGSGGGSGGGGGGT